MHMAAITFQYNLSACVIFMRKPATSEPGDYKPELAGYNEMFYFLKSPASFVLGDFDSVSLHLLFLI